MPGCLRLILIALVPLGVSLFCQLRPADTGPVAVLFPPWWDSRGSLTAAGSAGPIVRFGAVPFVVVVDAADRDRLWAAGAWLLLDPAILGGCSPRTNTAT